MARSGGKRGVMEYHCLNRFRRRRLLAFLRRNNLPSTFDALKHETRVFFDLRFLRRLVADGRWQEAREYLSRFLPCLDEFITRTAPTAFRFITRLNVLDDLAHGKLGCIDAADDLETQLHAFPSTMIEADPHYAAAVCAVLYNGSHPAHWDLWTGSSLGSKPHRRHSSPWTQGLSCEPMDLEEIIDETLLAGKLEVSEQSDSCSEGISGSPVGLFIGESFGTAPANAVTKRLSQECSAESANGAKLKPTTGEVCPDVVNAVDADHVLIKVKALGDISNAMIMLVKYTSTHGPDPRMFVEKLMEQEKLLFELRLDCVNAMIRGCTSSLAT